MDTGPSRSTRKAILVLSRENGNLSTANTRTSSTHCAIFRRTQWSMAKSSPLMIWDGQVSICFNTHAPSLHASAFIFDLLIYRNRDLTRLPFIQRREIMDSVPKFRSPRIRIAEHFEASGEEILRAVREQGLEVSYANWVRPECCVDSLNAFASPSSTLTAPLRLASVRMWLAQAWATREPP